MAQVIPAMEPVGGEAKFYLDTLEKDLQDGGRGEVRTNWELLEEGGGRRRYPRSRYNPRPIFQ